MLHWLEVIVIGWSFLLQDRRHPVRGQREEQSDSTLLHNTAGTV